MPFTFSHPAIILPLTGIGKKYISSSALIIGSMAPDFEYFIHMKMVQHHGHTIPGMFYYDLPLTIILCFIFHLLVKNALYRHCPRIVQKRFANDMSIEWLDWVKRYWYVLIYSSLLGIGSHLLWDSFTHHGRFFVELIPFLQENIWVFSYEMKMHDLMQLLCSGLGALIILAWIILPVQQAFNFKLFLQKIGYWICVTSVLLMTLFLRNFESLGDFIATFIAGGLLGLILTPIILQFTSRIILKKQI